MLRVHWWAEGTGPKDTVLKDTVFVEVVGVVVVEDPVDTVLQGVPVDGVVVGYEVVRAGIGLLEFLSQDSSVMLVPVHATGPETVLGGTAAVQGLREAELVETSCVAGRVIHGCGLGGRGLADLSTLGWAVAVDGGPVSQGKGVQHDGSEDQDCVAHHNNGYKCFGDFLDQLPWAHL